MSESVPPMPIACAGAHSHRVCVTHSLPWTEISDELSKVRQEATAYRWAAGLQTDQVFHARRVLPCMVVATATPQPSAASSSATRSSTFCSRKLCSPALHNQRSSDARGHISRAQPITLSVGVYVACARTWCVCGMCVHVA